VRPLPPRTASTDLRPAFTVLDFISVLFGLGAAASWGAGDFCGGFASKRCSSFTVVLVAQIVGAIFLVLLALAFQESWTSMEDMAIGGVAGVAGMVGLLALYTGLSSGRMSVFAPISAIVSVALPAAVAIATDGWPLPTTLVGFLLAVPAVWLLSSSDDEVQRLRARELRLALTAGLGFGLFFVLIDQVREGAVYWPLVSARLTAITVLSLFLAYRRLPAPPKPMTNSDASPGWTLPLAISLTGIFDAGGNACFAMSAQSGRLDVAAVLSSLYPAMTAFLAWMLLKERLSKSQWIGVAGASTALLLIAA
jgi:drug/metabolite transporter (DMT)-like permease